MLPGGPNIVEKFLRHSIAVLVDVSLHGMAHGNLLNSSTIVRINLFSKYFDLGNGPLKSIDNLSIGWVALIKVPGMGLKNWGFNSQQDLQLLHTISTSTSCNEYRKFLIFTWWKKSSDSWASQFFMKHF